MIQAGTKDWALELLEYHLTRDKQSTAIQYGADLKVYGRYLVGGRDDPINNVEVVRALVGPCREGNPAATKKILRGFSAWALAGGTKVVKDREGTVVRPARGYSQAFVRRLQSSFRSLMGAALELGEVEYVNRVIPVLIDQGPPKRNVRSPGRDAIMEMISITRRDKNREIGLRNELAMWLMFANALRVGEVCSIEYPAGVDLKNETVWVRPKGHHDREEIALPRETVRVLRDYLELRGEDEGMLMVTGDRKREPGQGITTLGFWKVVRDLGRKIGMRVAPHMLRHGGITELARLTNANDLWAAILSRHRVYRGSKRMWQRYQDDPVYSMREAANIVQRGRFWTHPTAR